MSHCNIISSQIKPKSPFSDDNDLEEDCPIYINNQLNRPQMATSFYKSHSTTRPVLRNEDIGPELNPYERYKYERKRLETFNDWPSNSAQKKEDLARNGFIYLHKADRTQCVFCRVILSHWDMEDVVENEHKTRCPECMFAHGLSLCGNVPIVNPVSQQQTSSGNFSNQGYSNSTSNNVSYRKAAFHGQNGISDVINTNCADALGSGHNNGASNEPKYKEWSDEKIRVKSFVGWPPNMTQKPIQLARAGLLYMGHGDRCKCYWCGGELYSWEPEDEPWEEHAKWFENCGYVRQVMGPNFIQFVKDKQNGLIDETLEQFMLHPHVLEVLRNDYTNDEVREAFNKYGYMRLINTQAIIDAIEEMRKAYLEDLNNKNQSLSGTNEELSASNVYQPDDDLHAKEGDKHIPKTQDRQAGQKLGSASGTNQIGDKEIDKVTEEFEKLHDMKLCKICKDKDLCMTFFPCGHLATCVDCAQTLMECPICRKPITQKHLIYWS